MSSQDLGVCRTVEGFQYRGIVVELCQRSVELDQEHIVDSWMTDIMANR